MNKHDLEVTYLNTPRMGSPFCTAMLLFMRRTAPAPSLTWLELPMIKVPNYEMVWNQTKCDMFMRKIIMRVMYPISAVVLPSLKKRL